MERHAPPTLAPAGFAAACAECGTASHDRQYVRILGRHTCEHCLLDSRKRLGGLENDPYEMFVESLAEALDLRERETGLHSKRVATHTLLLAMHHYKRVSDLREVYWGGLLHDIGKIGVPDAVLLNPGRLSDKEWHIMREHPRNGHRILQNLPFLSMAADIVLCHEERFDGSGYPAGLKGEEIPLAARLFAVIDTLDAMTFDRPYRKALPFDTAKAEILHMAGSQFDPRRWILSFAKRLRYGKWPPWSFPRLNSAPGQCPPVGIPCAGVHITTPNFWIIDGNDCAFKLVY